MAADCDFDPDHHFNIIIENKSENPIIVAELFKLKAEPIKNPDLIKCVLGDAIRLELNDIHEHRPFNNSIEKSIGNRPIEIYIIGIDKYHESNVYDDCSLIESKNNVLKRYILTLQDLEDINFKIVYSGE
jgi:hypothetical protein